MHRVILSSISASFSLTGGTDTSTSRCPLSLDVGGGGGGGSSGGDWGGVGGGGAP